MTTLKAFDSLSQGGIINLRITGISIRRQIADQTQKARKPWDTCILLTGVDGLCWNGKLFAVILAGQLHISI